MAKRKPKELDELDKLVEGDPLQVIALMLWKNRMREPDMYVQIFEKDIQALNDCITYLKVPMVVSIHRPQGEAAQAAEAGTTTRRPVPARPAQPPKPYVIVTLVDDRGDLIKPVENNQADFDAASEAANVRKAKDRADELSARVLRQVNSGETSLSDIQDMVNDHNILARAV